MDLQASIYRIHNKSMDLVDFEIFGFHLHLWIFNEIYRFQ